MASTQRLDVQGLRATSIISVLLFHFYPLQFPNGYLGVDVFFVISGYLIFTIFSRNVQRDGLTLTTTLNFYYRRMARIVPLSLLYVCFAVVAFTYMAPSNLIPKSQGSAWKALLFLTNIYAITEKNNYFERLLDENLFTHTWSLAVEESYFQFIVQYYLLVPFLFLINNVLCSNNNVIYPFVVVGSFVLYLYTPLDFSFNMMPTRLWQFLPITLFAAANHGQRQETSNRDKLMHLTDDQQSIDGSSTYFLPKFSEKVLYYCSYALLSLPFCTFPLNQQVTRVLLTFSATIIIVYGHNFNNSLLTNQLSVFVGDISYSLYLFHWPFSVYLSSHFTKLDINWGIPLSLTTTLVVYFIFEKQYRHWTKGVVLASSLLLVVLAAALILLSPQLNEAMQTQVSDAKKAAIQENEYMFTRAGITELLTVKNCDCIKWGNVTFEPHHGLCTMPKGDGKLKFMVIGNSYAANQATLVYEAFKPYFSNFSVFSVSGCEVFSRTGNDMFCDRLVEFNEVLSRIQPDVTFVIQRYILPRSTLAPSGTEDKVYEEMKQRLSLIYNLSSLFFVGDSIPGVVRIAAERLNAMIREGRSINNISKVVIDEEGEGNVATRIRQLMEFCGSKCQLYDLKPAISDSSGQVLALSDDSFLAIYEPLNHLTKHGLKRISTKFRQMAREHDIHLRALENTLYSSNS